MNWQRLPSVFPSLWSTMPRRRRISCLLIALIVLVQCVASRADLEPQQPDVGPVENPPFDSDVKLDAAAAAATKASSAPKNAYADLGFVHGFLASLSVILVSEIGDKTFFIAAIMAMRHPRLVVFLGAISALALMTVLSAVFGLAATIIPRVYTFYISTALFAIFGIKMLNDGYKMSPNDGQEELEEVQMDLKKREDELENESSNALVADPESGSPVRKPKSTGLAAYLTSRVLIQAFTMTFVAEWGDRSQLTTIILGAREDVTGVIVGGVLGHSLCTGLAVIGGRMIAQRISVRTVTLVGGVVFLLFALSALFISHDEEAPIDV